MHILRTVTAKMTSNIHILVPEKEGAGATGIASTPRRYSNIGDTNTNLRVSEYPKQFGEEGNTH